MGTSNYLAADLAIDQLSQHVRVPGMACSFFEKVRQDPSKIDHALVIKRFTRFIETRRASYDSIDRDPHLRIARYSGVQL